MNRERQRDRIMHLLLSEGLAGQSPPDLSLRIFARAFPEPTISTLAALEPDEMPLPTLPALADLPTRPRLPGAVPRPMPREEAAPPARPARRNMVLRFAKPLAAAAMLIFVIGIFMYVNRPYPQPTIEGGYSITTGGTLGRGSQVATSETTARLVLGGAYHVELAPKTKLTINGAPHAEAVTLENGQITCELSDELGDLTITTEAGTLTAADARFRASLQNETPSVTTGKGETSMDIRKKLLVTVFSGVVTVSGSWGQTSFAAGAEHGFVATGPLPVVAAATTAPPQANTAATRIAGTIASLSADSISVSVAGGATVAVTVTPNTTFKVSDKPATFADLKPGMNVVIYITASSTQVIASVPAAPKPPAPPATINVTGTISALADGRITITSSTRTTVVTVTDATVVRIKDAAATLADLKTGMSILAITTDGKTATEIHAYVPTTPPTPTPPPAANTTYTGTITAAADNAITIHTSAGAIVVTVNDKTIIRIKDVLSSFDDLKAGMTIAAVANPDKMALEIHAYVPSTPPAATTTVGGTLSAITGDTVTIVDGTKSTKLGFTNSTTFNVNGAAAHADALKVGMHIYATTTDGKVATTIRAYTPTPTTTPAPTPATTTLTGTISTLSATQIGVQSSTRTNILGVTSTTIFKLNGNVVGRGDLKAGMSVAVLTADGKTATEVRAYSTTTTTTAASVNGVVGQIAGTQITIQDGTKVTVVTFNTATTFSINGAASNADALKVGMRISAAVTDGKVAKSITAYTPTSATSTK